MNTLKNHFFLESFCVFTIIFILVIVGSVSNDRGCHENSASVIVKISTMIYGIMNFERCTAMYRVSLNKNALSDAEPKVWKIN